MEVATGGRSSLRRLAISAFVCIVAVSCTNQRPAERSTPDASETTTAVDAPPPSEPQEVTIVAVDYAYSEAPTELEAGVVELTFENRGTVAHELALMAVGDTPTETFLEDRDQIGLAGKPVPEYLDEVAVPIGPEDPGTTKITFTITEGRYFMSCSITQVPEGDEATPHYELGMIRELMVTGGESEPGLPEADGTITAFDYGFEVDLEPGDRTVSFINEGPDQIHFATVEEYRVGVGAAEAREAYAAGLGPGRSPEGVPSPRPIGYFSGIFSAGLGSTLRLPRGFEFETGRTYAFACYVPDREGGEPHAVAYGMFEIVTIE